MKTDKNILIAFLLNFVFAVFEFVGGIFSGSIAIVSDAVHDLGDSASIGVAYLLEKKSKKEPDNEYTYGYARYSVLGGAITTFILIVGSIFVIVSACGRLLNPLKIDYSGMIIFAVVGFFVNLFAAFFTRDGESLNQRAVNLHMLEDVLGWAVVLIGAVVMRFTDWAFLDPVMSIFTALFILINAFKGLREVAEIFLEKTPDGIDVEEIKAHLSAIEGVCSVHHIHIRSIDGVHHYATMHIVATGNPEKLKRAVRNELSEHGICHSVLELEGREEHCDCETCHMPKIAAHHHHHHH